MQQSSETVVFGTNDYVLMECGACDAATRHWTHKSINGGDGMEDLGKGSEKVRNRLDEKGELRHKFPKNYSDCVFNVLITGIQFYDAGTFTCWEGSLVLKTTVVVVVEKTVSCSSESEFPHSKNIIVKQNDPITKFKCYFQYSADESCIVTPIWTDFTGSRNFSIPLYDINADNNHAWIEFKPGADIINGSRLNLSLSFNCSLNNSQNHPIGRYDFGLLPFIFYVEGKSEFNINSFSLIVTLTMYTVVVMILSTLALFLICLKKYSKWCFANRANTETIELGKDPSEKDREYMGLRQDRRTSISNVYDAINGETYEVIVDPEIPVEI